MHHYIHERTEIRDVHYLDVFIGYEFGRDMKGHLLFGINHPLRGVQ